MQENGFPPHFDHRFGKIGCQFAQARAAPCCKQNCLIDLSHLSVRRWIGFSEDDAKIRRRSRNYSTSYSEIAIHLLKSAARSLTVALMAALQFLGKYRETGLLLIRASLGLIFIILIAPVLWNGQGSWEHFGSAMRHLDFHSHYKFWGFLGALLGCAGGVLMILGLFFRIGVLFALAVT